VCEVALRTNFIHDTACKKEKETQVVCTVDAGQKYLMVIIKGEKEFGLEGEYL
jgi:hypothetical protein